MTPSTRTLAALVTVMLAPSPWPDVPLPSEAFAQSTRITEAPGSPAAPLEAGLETDVASRYLYRGLVYDDGPVVQSRAWLGVGGFELYGWSNVPLVGALDEVDLGASYAYHRSGLTLTPAIDVYWYRDTPAGSGGAGDPSTAEVSLTLARALGPVKLSTTQLVDVRAYRGAYLGQIGLAHERQWHSSMRTRVILRGAWSSARFNDAYVGVHRAGPSLASADASITIALPAGVYLRPHASASRVLVPGFASVGTRRLNVTAGLAIGVLRRFDPPPAADSRRQP